MEDVMYSDEVNELLKKVLEKCYFISTHSLYNVIFEYLAYVNSFNIYYYKKLCDKEGAITYLEGAFLADCSTEDLSRALINLDKLYEKGLV